jgi:hypothetical protein
MSVVLAADTLSITHHGDRRQPGDADHPGGDGRGIVNPIFWLSMAVALTAAFFAALPVNRYLLARGKGHALTHQYHHGDHTDQAEHAEQREHAHHG